MNEKVTTETILSALKMWVEEKQPIGPDVWIDACSKLNILLGDEQALLYELQQDVAKLKVIHIEEGDSVAKAQVKIEASNLYRNMQIQKGKIERIIEQIKIAKIQSRMSSDERRGY